MKLFAPNYYGDFRCIADKCRHSCCIGWEIDIDDEAMGRYRAMAETCDHPYGRTISESIDPSDAPHFRLTADEHCPHLDDTGLCRIIKSLGEGYLCHICREHPRFYHDTAFGKEVGLGMACEAACRLILSSPTYAVLTEVGEIEGEAEVGAFDSLLHRERLYALLSDGAVPYAERLCRISRAYAVSPRCRSDEEWRRVIDSLEYLDDGHRLLFLKYTAEPPLRAEHEQYAERLLAYFIFRYCSDAGDAEELRASLGFCMLCERLYASLLADGDALGEDPVFEAARIISEEIDYSEDNAEALRFTFLFE